MRPAGQLRAQYAVLADRFGLRPWEIERLTPRQIQEVYLHPREPDGSIKVPAAPPPEPAATDPAAVRASLLQRLDGLVASGAISRADHAKALDQVNAKYPPPPGE